VSLETFLQIFLLGLSLLIGVIAQYENEKRYNRIVHNIKENDLLAKRENIKRKEESYKKISKTTGFL